MFLDVSPEQRATFFEQCTSGFIPGYTGHCPTLKFRIGKCYGANTKQIMQEISDNKINRSVAREPYRKGDPGRPENPPMTSSKGQARNHFLEVTQHRSRRYIMGYTGYIPGLTFRYGKSYVRAADDCMAEFGNRLVQTRTRYETERRARSAPQMAPIRGRDDVNKALNGFERKTKLQGHHLSPNSPPIAGYTGHIPRMSNTESSIAQRYNCVARQGLAKLQDERNARKELRSAERKVAQNVAEVQAKHNHDSNG